MASPTRRPRTGLPALGSGLVVLVLTTMLATLLGSAVAFAQSTGLVIRNLDVQANGDTSVSISLPPGIDAAAIRDTLEIRENGIAIEDFDLAETTNTEGGVLAEVALLIDTSGSLSDDARPSGDSEAFDQAKAAAIDFVADVTANGIPVTLISFASDATVQLQASTDLQVLTQSITALSTGGDTALNEAIVSAAGILQGRPADRPRTIVVFTDGRNDNHPTTEADALAAAGNAQATIAAVALGDTVDRDALQRLSSQTGGSLLSVAEASQLRQALGDVAASITSQLTISWFSDNAADRTVTVTVTAVVDGQVLTDRRAVPNVRTGVTPQGPPLPPVPSQPRLVGGTAALALGLGAAALGVIVLTTTLLVPPATSRSAKVLKRQLAGPAQTQATEDGRPLDEVRLKERVAAVMDAVPKPSGFDANLQSQLDQAAWPLRSGEFLALSIGLVVAGLAFTVFNPVVGLTLAVVGGLVPRLILIQRRQKRTKLFHEQLPDTLQMLAGSLRAGYGLMQGLENVSSEGTPPTATEFGRVLTETRLGVPLEDALGAMADRVGSDDFRWVTVAISIQRKVGGNLAELLDTVANTLRERDQVRRQVQVLSAEGKLSAVILVALPIVFALYLAATNPDYLSPLVTTTPGRLMVVGGVALLGVGIAWIRNVVRIDV